MDFYKFLKLPKSMDSTSREIIKNLRKLSRKYHPDKNKKFKKLYERLNLATQFLANDDMRKSYDYYLKNGFPDYDFSKGGFFFTRVQPKTWFILSFVFLFTGVIHYLILKVQASSNRRRIEGFVKQCKDQDDTQGLGEKRLSFKQHEEDEAKELIVKFGQVYIIESDGMYTLVSPDSITEPTLYDSILFKLPLWFWKQTLGRFITLPTRKSVEKPRPGEQVLGTASKPEKASKNDGKRTTSTTIKPGQQKKVLENGKVIYSRKKD